VREMTMSETKDNPVLRICPFCGGNAEYEIASQYASINCTKCRAQMTVWHADFPEYNPRDLLRILTDAWNIRVIEQPPPNVSGSGTVCDDNYQEYQQTTLDDFPIGLKPHE
jgi:hypothetical protein